MSDNSYTTKNYFTDGGDTLVLGGNVVFTEDAVVDDQGGALPSGGSGGTSSITPVQDVEDSTATTVVAMKEDFNTLLSRLRDSGLLMPR